MNKYIGEFIGTFFFISIVLNTLRKNTGMASIPISIGVGLIAAIILVGPISGAHLNPAISLVSYLYKSITQEELLFYVVAQCAGGVAAKYYFDNLQ